MGARGDAFYAKAVEKISEQIGEPVAMVGWASRTGAMDAVISTTLNRTADTALGLPNLGTPIPKSRMLAAGGAEGAKLPVNFLVALTPTALRAFEIGRGWSGIKVKGELGALPRRGLHLQADDAGITTRFRLDATDGSAIGFEMTRSGVTTRFTEELRAQLDSGGP